MKLTKRYSQVLLVATLLTVQSNAQTINIQNTYMDNALNFNKLLKERSGEGEFKLIGPYKVKGTSYLFGERNTGDLYSTEAKAYNISLSYNTYNQQVEFFSSSNPDKPLLKEPGEVDSFLLKPNTEVGILQGMNFIYGAHLGSQDKAFFLEIYKGARYSVYKKYKSDLTYVTGNYVQPELREFDLLYEYYYHDNQKPGLKKLKANSASIVKELKGIKDITPVFTDADFTANQELALKKAFQYLNQ